MLAFTFWTPFLFYTPKKIVPTLPNYITSNQPIPSLKINFSIQLLWQCSKKQSIVQHKVFGKTTVWHTTVLFHPTTILFLFFLEGCVGTTANTSSSRLITNQTEALYSIQEIWFKKELFYNTVEASTCQLCLCQYTTTYNFTKRQTLTKQGHLFFKVD